MYARCIILADWSTDSFQLRVYSLQIDCSPISSSHKQIHTTTSGATEGVPIVSNRFIKGSASYHYSKCVTYLFRNDIIVPGALCFSSVTIVLFRMRYIAVL